MMGPGNVAGTMYYGYPTGRSRVPSYFGIKDWMQVGSGISVLEVSDSRAEFRLDLAPDPSNCKVNFVVPTTYGDPPSITKTSSGC